MATILYPIRLSKKQYKKEKEKIHRRTGIRTFCYLLAEKIAAENPDSKSMN
jgi:hypothetical protein